MTPSHHGVALGAASPLLTPAQVRRKLEPLEEDIQIAAFELLVGRCDKGRRREPGAGMTGRFPELSLLYAIPNGGGRSKATAGRMKAQGVLASIPDMHLPVMRGPFVSLYLELKRPSANVPHDQREMHERLRQEGHCVLVCRSVQHVVNAVIGYLTLPTNRPSVRPLGAVGGPIEARLAERRTLSTLLLAENTELTPNAMRKR